MTTERVEVLVIGDELLDGRVADTNTLRFATALADVGRDIEQRTTVRDDIKAIVREASAIVARGTTLCLVSGGLGPTADDLTAEAFAELARVPLLRDPAAVRRIEQRLARRAMPVRENHLKQAEVPQGARVIANPQGMAPGFAIEVNGCRFVALPGIPQELAAMLEEAILSPLRGQGAAPQKRLLKTFGLVEAEVDGRLKALTQRWPNVRVGFRVKFPEIHVTLTAKADAGDLSQAATWACEQLGPAVFSQSEAGLAEVLVRELEVVGATLATAESCTGGIIADLITDVPGGSTIFLQGVVAYANQAKVSLLGVDRASLDLHGAVSEEVVTQMAMGVRERAGATFAVATSGIAGPGGGTADKPVGTVWLAVVGPQGTKTRKLTLPFERRGNKQVSAYAALALLRQSVGRPG